ncbi:MAG: phosphoglycolate phosphatase [Gammaproteobacteria bacterium]
MNAALFDLDGTLVDSAPDIAAAANAMLHDLALPPLSAEDARQYIGDGLRRFVKRALTRRWRAEPAEELFQRALSRMEIHYRRECTARRRVYPGVRGVLAALKKCGMRLGCVTNKPAQFTPLVLKACRLDMFFEAVISGDSLPAKKPDPLPLREACRILQTPCADAWMVGDSPADAKAANAAGCRFIAASYGYHRDLPFAAHVVYNFREILPLLRRKD